MWKKLLVLVAALRFITPFSVFVFPGFAAAAALILDTIDGYVGFKTKMAWKYYHVYDKLMDFWWYFFIVLAVRNQSVFWIFLILFIHRAFGQLVSLITNKVQILLFFPNILEMYFWIYLLSPLIPELNKLFIEMKQGFILLPIILIAIGKEYILHIKKLVIGNLLFNLHFYWSKNKKNLPISQE